jgi:1-acyl-sn-glycerol-3-phosphate acyltransferase
VTILGTHQILPTDTLDLTPGEARLVFHAPISTQGLDASDLPRLISQSREAILDTLNRA